ncbi:uncharacterized protein LOC120481492 [Pimephales promelas]|uniref:uncharacterized protein LOC120481492 n=1 Tax=Pimephales promelas TaxID=90988 RepID=UPI00195567E2|nr:uncharacterized protein LOC120481492 [Pimephales promelas]
MLKIFKRCAGQPESSVNDEATLVEGETNPPDDTSHIVMGLLKYFKGFQCLLDTKEEIEIKCAIEKNLKFWKIEKIKQAWDKANKITVPSDKKHWSYVIMLQMMAHLQNKCAGQAAQNSRTGESHSSEHNQIESIGAESGAQHSTFNETNEVSENPSKEKLQKDDGTGEIRSEESNSGTVYIKIPLSDLSDGELKQAAHVDSNYKFIEGYPSNRPNTEIRRKTHYVMSYNKDTNNAEWVYEILNESTLTGKDLQQGHQQDLQQGHQQGHLAAAANHSWCQEAYNSTFCFSNISPQLKILNMGLWKTLEEMCRERTKTKNNVHVYTGAVWTVLTEDGSKSQRERNQTKERHSLQQKKSKNAPKKISINASKKISKTKSKKISINAPRKASFNASKKITKKYIKMPQKKNKKSDGSSKTVKKVPTQFFKVIIVEKDDGTVEKPECYLLPNDLAKLVDFKDHNKIYNRQILSDRCRVQRERIEELSGLKFTAETCRNGETDSIKTVKWEGEVNTAQISVTGATFYFLFLNTTTVTSQWSHSRQLYLYDNKSLKISAED